MTNVIKARDFTYLMMDVVCCKIVKLQVELNVWCVCRVSLRQSMDVKKQSHKRYAQYVEKAIIFRKMENAIKSKKDVFVTLMENVWNVNKTYMLTKNLVVRRRSVAVSMSMENV